MYRAPLLLERPEHGDQEGGYQPEDDGEGEAGTEEVAELVAAGTVNEGIGLVADRGGEAGGGAKHDGDIKGTGSTPRDWAMMMARGVSRTATALLDTISVKTAASR